MLTVFRRAALASGALGFLFQALGLAALSCGMTAMQMTADPHAGHHASHQQPPDQTPDTHGQHCLCAVACQMAANVSAAPGHGATVAALASRPTTVQAPAAPESVRAAPPHTLPFATAPPAVA